MAQHWRKFGRFTSEKEGRIELYLVDYTTVIVSFLDNHENPGEWWSEFNELAEKVLNEYESKYGRVNHSRVMYAYN